MLASLCRAIFILEPRITQMNADVSAESIFVDLRSSVVPFYDAVAMIWSVIVCTSCSMSASL